VSSVAFSPDGGTLASGSWDSTIILWDLATGQPIGGPLEGHSSLVSSVAFSPDGGTLASGSWDDTIILWDLATGQPIGGPLEGHSSLVSSVAFSPDGETLASGSWDNTVILWDLAPSAWAAANCRRAGRNFTRAEWAQYFRGEPYRVTCPQWPPAPESTSSPTP
jgi:WD40 repeat protein